MLQKFYIETIPKGQGRPRFVKIGRFSKVYDPADSRDYKSDLKWQIISQHPKFMEGAISMVCEFHMPRPKSHYSKRGLKTNAPHYCTTKPDLDNLIKAVKDAITSTGKVWKDDSQVVVEYGEKVYREVPGISIILRDANENRNV